MEPRPKAMTVAAFGIAEFHRRHFLAGRLAVAGGSRRRGLIDVAVNRRTCRTSDVARPLEVEEDELSEKPFAGVSDSNPDPASGSPPTDASERLASCLTEVLAVGGHRVLQSPRLSAPRMAGVRNLPRYLLLRRR